MDWKMMALWVAAAVSSPVNNVDVHIWCIILSSSFKYEVILQSQYFAQIPPYLFGSWPAVQTTNLKLNNNEIERYIHLHTFLPVMTATGRNTSSMKDYVNVALPDICSRLKANP